MVSEIGSSGFSFETASFYQARKSDSADKSSLSDKSSADETRSKFTLATKTGDEGKPSDIQKQYEQKSQAYLRETLSKPYSQGANLYGQSMAGQDLQGGSYTKADFRATDLKNAKLAGADLRGADLTSADLAGADLRGANLTGANFNGANIAGANLAGAIGTKYDRSGRLTIDRSISLPSLDISA